MSLKTVKRIASRVFGAGATRIRFTDGKKAAEALTADDVRQLGKQGVIEVRAVKSVGRGKARLRGAKKRRGRRSGPGRHKGTPNAVLATKKKWIGQVRSQRRLLAHVKPTLAKGAYHRLYRMIKGGLFRNKRALDNYITEHNFKVEKK